MTWLGTKVLPEGKDLCKILVMAAHLLGAKQSQRQGCILHFALEGKTEIFKITRDSNLSYDYL